MKTTTCLLALAVASLLPFVAADSPGADSGAERPGDAGLNLTLSHQLTLAPSGTPPTTSFAPLAAPVPAASTGNALPVALWTVLGLGAGLALGFAMRRRLAPVSPLPTRVSAREEAVVQPAPVRPRPEWQNTVTTLERDVRQLRRALDAARDNDGNRTRQLAEAARLETKNQEQTGLLSAENLELRTTLAATRDELGGALRLGAQSQAHSAAAHQRSVLLQRSLTAQQTDAFALRSDLDDVLRLWRHNQDHAAAAHARAAVLRMTLERAMTVHAILRRQLIQERHRHRLAQNRGAAAFGQSQALRRAYDGAEKQAARASGELAQSSRAAAELFVEFQSLRERWRKQSTQLDDTAARALASERQRAAVDAQRKKDATIVKAAEARAARAEADVGRVEARLDEANAGAAAQADALAVRANELARLQRLLKASDNNIKSLRQSNAAMEAELDTLASGPAIAGDGPDASRDGGDNTAEMAIVASARDNAGAEDTGDATGEQTAILTQLNGDLADREQTIAALVAQLDSVSANGEDEDLRVELTRTQQKMRALQSDLRLRDDIIRTLESDSRKLTRLEKDLQERTSRIAFLDHELGMAIDELARLRKTDTAADATPDAALEAAQAQIATQEKIIEALEMAAASTPDSEFNDDDRLRELNNDLTASRTLIRFLEEEVRGLKRRIGIPASHTG